MVNSMMKKIILGISIILGGFGIVFYRQAQNENNFMYAGTLETTKVVISSKVGTDIISLPFHEGDHVKKGDDIIALNDDIYQIASKQINNEYGRYLRLKKNGHVTQENFDRIERNKKDNDLKIMWCHIKSPIDGIIITKFKEPGEYVNIGSNIISLSNPKDIWAYFYVSYDMVHKLKIGDKVVGRLQEVSDREFHGRIIKINEEAEFTPKNVQTREERQRLVYGIKVRFDNDDLLLKAGMTMETSFNDGYRK